MNITVLNGSPKGPDSVTVQYVRFLQKMSPQHQFTFHNVCQEIKRLEEDAEAFQAVVRAVEAADVVLWATPVYVLLVPGPYKRFIELVFERSAHAVFRGKHAAVLTTSVRFFDHTAHNYLHSICDDLGMRFAGSYSAEMYDLLSRPERLRLLLFWRSVVKAVQEQAPAENRFRPLESAVWTYTPGGAASPLPTGGRKIVVLTDAQEHSNLERMVARLCHSFAEPVELVNLNQIKMLGGCTGCIHCGLDNVCVYRGADDVFGVYAKLRAADIVVEAGTIRDRFLSSRWKTFWDRGFFNNHVPILVGKQVAFLVSGPLMQLADLRQVLEARAELQQASLAGIVTDECGDSGRLDRQVDHLARRLLGCAETGYLRPGSFLGKAGRKLLRDEIWASLRFVFQADHAYYRRHGLYDFPRRSLGTRLSEAWMRLLMLIPAYRREFQRRIKTEMTKPLERVVKDS